MGFLVFLIGVVKIQRSVFSLPFVSAKSTFKGEKERILVLDFFVCVANFPGRSRCGEEVGDESRKSK